MGSGSRGGGSGGGSGGGGSRGSGGGGGGGESAYRYDGSKVISNIRPLEEVKQVTKRIFRDPNRREYLIRQFSNPLVRSLYEQLFSLYQQLVLNRSWEGIEREFGVADGPGCLKSWVEHIFQGVQKQETDQRMQDAAKNSVRNFVLDAIGDDTHLYLRGTGSQVVQRIDPNVLHDTSNNFLAKLIREILMREAEFTARSAETESQIGKVASQLANRVVDRFEGRFRKMVAKPDISYKQLFTVIGKNPEWFLETVRA